MQQQIQKTQLNNRGLFFYLSILTGFFILLEIGVFMQVSEFYLGDFKLVANHLKIPLAIVPAVFYYFCVQIFIHLCFVMIIWMLALLVGKALSFSPSKVEKFGIALWVLGIIVLLLANQYYYPNTKFSSLSYVFVRTGTLKPLLVILVALFFVVMLVAGYALIKIFTKTKGLRRFTFLSVLLLTGLGCFFIFKRPLLATDVATAERPNIIIIGVDALRPDFLGYFGSHLNTVHFDRFLNHAAVFSEALTPIARTYPAWVSILTGTYPKLTGVRFDLAGQVHFDLNQTLPSILRQQGYTTLFATDEVRFSNIDTQLGFDRLVTPPMGFNDFLLGTMNDFPMANLLVNTPLGRYLFPYSYGNRAAYVTYEPNTFLNLLRPTLEQKREKPLFLAVHLCLPHYPYSWASYPNNNQFLNNYRSAIKRADLQVFDLLKMLKKNRLLEHSIVVLLSDHGEALELAGDRVTEADLFIPGHANKKQLIPHFYPPSVKTELVNQSAGHGTDVLGLSQYHSVLAFRFFLG